MIKHNRLQDGVYLFRNGNACIYDECGRHGMYVHVDDNVLLVDDLTEDQLLDVMIFHEVETFISKEKVLNIAENCSGPQEFAGLVLRLKEGREPVENQLQRSEKACFN